ncbi:ATP-binding cassette sub-family A member 9 [Verticillium alfalfae VaMs.102]|uniref:ATP-binding cassette sub-family A member 9 n=1 Tax=Verticillium alfalfae (strain VaMs.102 / ATCC MYA-4576 / FGSC 10136) TaxID=526221 RepID=C9SW74_VERA1|nr:ATP-binding cassette sub-family A member 9 [Verticillium alfalfae VaMs.102]EEY23039.1 ATP-binding cassette sub-family A member 9 [Verticillium alfalfae VaMs.102]
MSSSMRLWVRQTQALTNKIFLITLKRHLLSTLIRALVIPILVVCLTLGIQKFTSSGNRFGVGSPSPAVTLSDVIPNNAKLFFIQSADAGSDVSAAIKTITDSLKTKPIVQVLQSDDELEQKCPTDINGRTDCYAAVTFNDSPLSSNGANQWNYTLRVSSSKVSSGFNVFNSNKAAKNPYAPLQLAVDQAITNSTTVPDMYTYTRTTPEDDATQRRKDLLSGIFSGLSVVCFISMLSLVYHMVGMIADERESGMAQLIDVMGGGAAAARVSSYLIAFNIIYLPSFIIMGGVFSSLLFPSSSAGIPILWQVLTGWALTSSCVFGATFTVRYSAICAVAAIVGMAVFAMSMDTLKYPIDSSTAIGFSIVFPSCSYIIVLNLMARFERIGRPIDIFASAPMNGVDMEVEMATIGTLLGYLVFTIVAFPLATILIERWTQGISNKGRKFSGGNQADDGTALQVKSLTKKYSAPLWKRIWCCFCCGRNRPFVAVDNLDFTSQKQQILCLLGINGSGKTTTMDLITGRQKPASGVIEINAASSQIGFCPQRNIHWGELTVFEHAYIWNMIKGGSATTAELEQLVDSCDLRPKMNSQVATLSGGQKRKVQLACMLAGGSTICLMDEVTTGMVRSLSWHSVIRTNHRQDPVSRRAIWNIVLAERSRRSMILTTHFLDECEVLADQVVVISRGHLKCHGSPAELKNIHGGGYRVRVPQVNNVPQTSYPMAVYQGETIYTVPDSTSATRLLSSLEAAGLSDVLVTGPTIEEVFLRVANEPEALEKRGTGLSDLAPLTISGEAFDGQLSSGTSTTFLQQLMALTIKRLTILRGNYWWYILALIIALPFSPTFTSMLKSTDMDFNTVPYELPSCSDFEPSFFDEPSAVTLSNYGDKKPGDVSMVVGPQSARDSVFRAVDKFPIGRTINTTDFDSKYIFLNGYDSFLKRVHDNASSILLGAIYMGDGSAKPTIAYNTELGYDSPVTMQSLWNQARSGVPIEIQLAFFTTSLPVDADAGQLPAIIRALQYSNNVRPRPLWVSYIMVDIVIVTIVAALGTLALALDVKNWYHPAFIFPIMWLYGIASMLWCYIISLYTRSELAAFAFSACIMVLAFILTIVGFSLVIDAVSYSLGLLFPIMNLYRAFVVGLNVWLVTCRDFKLIANPGSFSAYGGPLALLIIQVLYLFPLLLWLDGKNTFSMPWGKKKLVDNEESVSGAPQDIEMKSMRVASSEKNLLSVEHVTKSFKGKRAVDDVSLAMTESSVIALLGPNGAGKTTLTNMMRGEMVPDSGRIFVQGLDVQQDTQAARRHIGVCPQFDALDKITARQQLEFYARIKGIKDMKRDVDFVMARVGLTPHASRLTHKLSGGNKRKLSLAIALLGNPEVLILDEPSSAMDAIAKREMWKMLSSITPGRSVLLTVYLAMSLLSQRLDANVDDRHTPWKKQTSLRLAWPSCRKRVLAIGTSQELRQRYSNVYDVHLVLATAPGSTRSEMHNIESWVQQVFPEASFDAASLGGQVRFVMPVGAGPSPDGRSTVRRLMETLEEQKADLGLAHYTVGMGTLEMVFLNIMRNSGAAEEEEQNGPNPKRNGLRRLVPTFRSGGLFS